MRQIASTCTSLLLVVSLFLSGCAETKDGRKTQAQGTALGAVGGALIGGLLGAATGNTNNIARFAIAGAVVGGTAGYIYGTNVAKRKARYARAEDWLNNEIALAQQTNNRAYAYNRTLKQRVAALDQRVAAARARNDKGAQRALKAEISQISQQAAQQNKSEAGAVEDQKVILSDAKARTASNYSSYQREANSFNQAKAERGQVLNHLASLDNSLDR